MSDDAPGEGRLAGRGDDRSNDQSPFAEEIDTGTTQLTTAITHFYRAESERMSTWRTRLDQTTNWAVVVIAAILTWAFSSASNPHYVLLIGMLATGAFLVIEAQRYQEYDAWRSRVRLLQENFFADAFESGEPEQTDWRRRLRRDLRNPTLTLPLWQAVAHRLQRVYFLLLTVLLAAWVARIAVFAGGEPWSRTAAIASVPGPAVAAGVGAGYLAVAGLTAWSFGRAAKREFDEGTRTHTPKEPGSRE